MNEKLQWLNFTSFVQVTKWRSLVDFSGDIAQIIYKRVRNKKGGLSCVGAICQKKIRNRFYLQKYMKDARFREKSSKSLPNTYAYHIIYQQIRICICICVQIHIYIQIHINIDTHIHIHYIQMHYVYTYPYIFK